MEYEDFKIDFKFFQDNLNALPNFYKASNGNLEYLHEQNKNDFFNLNSEEITDIILVLDELNKAIQINIDENKFDGSEGKSPSLGESPKWTLPVNPTVPYNLQPRWRYPGHPLQS